MPGEDMEMQALHEEEEVDLEKASLMQSREKSAALARAAYRAELATTRAYLLALLIAPVLLIILLWHLFDSNAHWGANTHSPPVQPLPYTGP